MEVLVGSQFVLNEFRQVEFIVEHCLSNVSSEPFWKILAIEFEIFFQVPGFLVTYYLFKRIHVVVCKCLLYAFHRYAYGVLYVRVSSVSGYSSL